MAILLDAWVHGAFILEFNIIKVIAIISLRTTSVMHWYGLLWCIGMVAEQTIMYILINEQNVLTNIYSQT